MAPGWGWFQIPAIQLQEQSQPQGSSLRTGRQWGWAEPHLLEKEVGSCEGGGRPCAHSAHWGEGLLAVPLLVACLPWHPTCSHGHCHTPQLGMHQPPPELCPTTAPRALLVPLACPTAGVCGAWPHSVQHMGAAPRPLRCASQWQLKLEPSWSRALSPPSLTSAPVPLILAAHCGASTAPGQQNREVPCELGVQ